MESVHLIASKQRSHIGWALENYIPIKTINSPSSKHRWNHNCSDKRIQKAFQLKFDLNLGYVHNSSENYLWWLGHTLCITNTLCEESTVYPRMLCAKYL